MGLTQLPNLVVGGAADQSAGLGTLADSRGSNGVPDTDTNNIPTLPPCESENEYIETLEPKPKWDGKFNPNRVRSSRWLNQGLGVNTNPNPKSQAPKYNNIYYGERRYSSHPKRRQIIGLSRVRVAGVSEPAKVMARLDNITRNRYKPNTRPRVSVALDQYILGFDVTVHQVERVNVRDGLE